MKYVTLLLIVWTISSQAQDSLIRTLGAQQTKFEDISQSIVAYPLTNAAIKPLKVVRMDDECPPVVNQGYAGACISYSTAYALCGILAKREYGWDYDGLDEPNMNQSYSPMFMHYFVRQCETSCDKCGSNLGIAGKFLTEYGVPLMKYFHPVVTDRNQTDPCSIVPPIHKSDRVGERYLLKNFNPLFIPGIQVAKSYKRNAIKSYVANKVPVPISIDIDESFYYGYAFNNSTDTWKAFLGNSIGSHAMLVVGYDESRSAFLVMNSWGTNTWNTKKNDKTNDAKPGFCWISYDIIDTYCTEAYVANQKNLPGSTTVSQYRNISQGVNTEPETKTTTNGKIQLFITNRYQQYGEVRLMPLHIDRKNHKATIAVYQINNKKSLLNQVFTIKMGDSFTFKVGSQNFDFHALYIKPYTKYLGIIPGADAVYFQLQKFTNL